MSAGIQRRPLPGITTLIEKFPLILFFALLVWLSLQSPFFLSWQNISMMLVQSVPLAILCFGLVCVIAVGGDDVVSGGIDLSLPAIAVLGVSRPLSGMAAALDALGVPHTRTFPAAIERRRQREVMEEILGK